MNTNRRSIMWWGFTMLVVSSLACAIPGMGQTDTSPGLEQTSIALGVQQTIMANEKATLSVAAPLVTPVKEPTATAPVPTDTSVPPTSTNEPLPTRESATETATVIPSATAVDIEAKIRSANILVYEDMMGYYERTPLVHEAISEMNFSGGRVIEVGDALGNFKEQLLNTTDWDLILIAAEYRRSVQGEFWKYVSDQVNRNVALVVEVWYLDQHYSDIQPLLTKCGVKFQKNWSRGPKYNLEDYAVYWLQPEHPFFHSPQDPVSLANPNYLYWVPPLTEDAGDLLQLASSGDAVLLGGTQPGSKSQYGVLATCLDGTMMVQTVSSHDYSSSEVVTLWKNYIRYTLTNHFLQQK